MSERRTGSTTSKKRDELLDAVERLMATKGYAAVSYRAVATEAGVTSGLVQYYFPTRDEMFLAAIRRRSDQNLRRLTAALDARPEQPLTVLWEYSQEESTAVLTTEFLALGNHLPSIAAEIAEVSEQVREIQMAAIRRRPPDGVGELEGISAGALVFLVTGLPKLLRLEEGVGLTSTHDETRRFLQTYLETVEPTSPASAG